MGCGGTRVTCQAKSLQMQQLLYHVAIESSNSSQENNKSGVLDPDSSPTSGQTSHPQVQKAPRQCLLLHGLGSSAFGREGSEPGCSLFLHGRYVATVLLASNTLGLQRSKGYLLEEGLWVLVSQIVVAIMAQAWQP